MAINKKILVSVFIIGLLAFGLGWGTYSYFSDTEKSTGNVFQAGTIDLAVNDENPWVSKLFSFVDVKPCEDLDPINFTFKNVGNNPGVLSFSISYVEKDKDVPADFEFPFNMTADGFASLVYVKAVTYQHRYPDGSLGSLRDDLPSWVTGMDDNDDGNVSLYEMKFASPIPYDLTVAPLLPGHGGTFMVTFHLGDSLDPWQVGGHIVTGVEDNRPQADGIEVTVTAILEQVGVP